MKFLKTCIVEFIIICINCESTEDIETEQIIKEEPIKEIETEPMQTEIVKEPESTEPTIETPEEGATQEVTIPTEPQEEEGTTKTEIEPEPEPEVQKQVVPEVEPITPPKKETETSPEPVKPEPSPEEKTPEPEPVPSETEKEPEEKEVPKIETVTIRTKYISKPGQIISVIGNVKLFGSWEPLRAKKMTWNENNIWTLTLPWEEMKDCEFKFLMKERGYLRHWSIGKNKVFKKEKVLDQEAFNALRTNINDCKVQIDGTDLKYTCGFHDMDVLYKE